MSAKSRISDKFPVGLSDSIISQEDLEAQSGLHSLDLILINRTTLKWPVGSME